jgi:hypothetical protein
MDSRFLKIKFDGILTEKFDRRFNIVKTAEDNRAMYINLVKTFAYLQQVKFNNEYTLKFRPTSKLLSLVGRRKTVFDEIVWVIDQYSQSQEEYDLHYTELEKCIISYKEMVNRLTFEREENVPFKVYEEKVE